MSKTTLPTSKAKTAYGLLSAVSRVILDDPLLFNQSTWIKRVDRHSAAEHDWIPACGIIGCVALWAAVLASSNGIPGNVKQAAEIVLGLTDEQAGELFNSSAVSLFFFAGTRQYAQVGARHIRTFQQNYSKQLKATKVPR